MLIIITTTSWSPASTGCSTLPVHPAKLPLIDPPTLHGYYFKASTLFGSSSLLLSVLADYFASDEGNSQFICNKIYKPTYICTHSHFLCPVAEEEESLLLPKANPFTCLLDLIPSQIGRRRNSVDIFFPSYLDFLECPSRASLSLSFCDTTYSLGFFCTSLPLPKIVFTGFSYLILNVEGPQGYTLPFCVPLTIFFKSPSWYCSVCVSVQSQKLRCAKIQLFKNISHVFISIDGGNSVTLAQGFSPSILLMWGRMMLCWESCSL